MCCGCFPSSGNRHYLDIGEEDLSVIGRPNNTLENVTADVIHSAIYAARCF